MASEGILSKLPKHSSSLPGGNLALQENQNVLQYEDNLKTLHLEIDKLRFVNCILLLLGGFAGYTALQFWWEWMNLFCFWCMNNQIKRHSD